MPEFYFPSGEVYEKISGLTQGFWLEKEEDETIVLLLKFEASILTKLIKGCRFELVIRNPLLSNRGMTLYVYDNPKDPLWVTYKEFGKEHEKFIGFDSIAIELIKAKKIRVAYFNHKNITIFTTLLEKENSFNEFEKWVYEVFNNNELLKSVDDSYFAPENRQKGFLIPVKNIDCSKEPKMNIHIPDFVNDWKESEFGIESYNFNDYLEDGKHGYNQEISLKDFLQNIFDVNSEIFHSPLKKDGNELIDFIICHKNASILLESKCVLSEKKTKLQKALTKAIDQLNDAKSIISDRREIINDLKVKAKIENCDIVLRICVFNDSQNILGGKTKNLIANYEKEELPIFISVRNLFQLFADIKVTYGEHYKFNLIQNLIHRYQQYINSKEEILIIRDYKLHKKE